jgi:signal transduction histidine kinase
VRQEQHSSTAHPQEIADRSALTHPGLSLTTIRALWATLLIALSSGVLEALYLLQHETVSALEWISLTGISILLAAILALLIMFPGKYIDRLVMTAFVGAILHLFCMLIGALYLVDDPSRSLHTMLWFHPAFIALTLTQPAKVAQSACLIVILLLTGLILFFHTVNASSPLLSTLQVNHWIIIFSLGASSSLLYALSSYREGIGADRARIAVLKESERALREEVEAKEQALRELERANMVVSDFLDNISHELRTPLNAIIGFSELIHGELLGGLANEKYKEYSGDILQSGQHMLELVNNLLYFTRLSAGRIELKRDNVVACEVLNSAAEASRRQANEADVRIVVEEDGQPLLHADMAGLLRILHNLLDNAIKFSWPGGEVLLKAVTGRDGACEICIRDNGVGIPQTELDTVLLPFRRGEGSARKATPGTGLGLSLAKAFMDQHGGSIFIDSAEDKGTLVTLLFPPPGSDKAAKSIAAE